LCIEFHDFFAEFLLPLEVDVTFETTTRLLYTHIGVPNGCGGGRGE
jgi:hypothetical protein